MDERRQLPPNDKKAGKNNIRKIPQDYQRKNIIRKVPVKKNSKDKEERPVQNSQKKVNINEENKRKKLYFQKLSIDIKERSVKIDNNDVLLTKLEYNIVELLALHAGQTFSREQIYERIWGYDSDGDSTTVVEHVKKIRAKFAEIEPDTEYISTVWGIGYKWNRI